MKATYLRHQKPSNRSGICLTWHLPDLSTTQLKTRYEQILQAQQSSSYEKSIHHENADGGQFHPRVAAQLTRLLCKRGECHSPESPRLVQWESRGNPFAANVDVSDFIFGAHHSVSNDGCHGRGFCTHSTQQLPARGKIAAIAMAVQTLAGYWITVRTNKRCVRNVSPCSVIADTVYSAVIRTSPDGISANRVDGAS
jgi:hypothetical protein